MSARRLLKAAEAIREVVSMAIVAELRDPRVRDVTVTHVEVSPDMRHAKVHVSIMGDEPRQKLALRGLQSAAGFLQAKIAEQIDTRYTPRLMFVLDLGVKKSIELARILKEVLPNNPGEEAADESDSFSPADQIDDADNSDADDEASASEKPTDRRHRPR
jgi:ribosome-binding factor A